MLRQDIDKEGDIQRRHKEHSSTGARIPSSNIKLMDVVKLSNHN